MVADPLARVEAMVCRWTREGDLRWLPRPSLDGWEVAEPPLVLRSEAGLELGPPGTGSCDLLVWASGLPASWPDGAVGLVGPDLGEAGPGPLSVARITVAAGDVEQRHATVADLGDALRGARVEGVMSEALPGDSRLWLRAGRAALGRGVSLSHLAAAAADALSRVAGVRQVATVWVVDTPSAVEPLRRAARRVRRTVEALYHAEHEPEMACDGCPYADLCAAVDGLQDLHLDLSRR